MHKQCRTSFLCSKTLLSKLGSFGWDTFGWEVLGEQCQGRVTAVPLALPFGCRQSSAKPRWSGRSICFTMSLQCRKLRHNRIFPFERYWNLVLCPIYKGWLRLQGTSGLQLQLRYFSRIFFRWSLNPQSCQQLFQLSLQNCFKTDWNFFVSSGCAQFERLALF